MILSIDFGSTNFKSALFDEELNRMGAFSLSAPYIHNDGSRVEMDADTVRETLVELIENCCQNAGVGTESITTFAAGSQAQNFTVLDESGNARYPVISWLDTRSSTEAEELWKMYGADWHKHYSFSKLNGSMRLAHLLWLYRNKPQIFDDDYQIVTLPGLLFEMVGGVNLTDNNLEAMNGLYSLLKKDWRLEPIKECGITSANLPKCVPVGSSVTVESNCSKLKLRKTITLVSAGNDQTAGAFGNGCQVDDIIATLGTALVAYRRTGNQPGPYSAAGCWGPYPGGGYYELAYTNNGCQAFDWAREVLMPGEGVRLFDDAVARAIPTIREKTGFFNPDKTNTPDAWQGTFANNDQKAYAVFEGIIFELHRLVFDDLAAPAGVPIRVIGGGSHSAVWLQLIADMLNCPVSVGSGDSLLGAAAMAAGGVSISSESQNLPPCESRHNLLIHRHKNMLEDL